jgi:ABC-type antimicrobial peptide transport system permease subunit
MVMRQGMGPVVAGLAMGLVMAVLSVRVLMSLLYGIEARDPATFAGAALILLACAIAACLVPASRAAQVNPASALRTS